MEDRIVSNFTLRVVLLGTMEITGENGLKSVLNFSGLQKYIDNFPPNDQEMTDCMVSEITKLDEGLEEIYGSGGARAILFQVGRMQAKMGLEEDPDLANAALDAVKDMDEQKKVKTILDMMAATLAARINAESWIEEDGKEFIYKNKEGTHCFNRESKSPICYTTEGFVYGILSWAMGNEQWKVIEESCMAMGNSCCTYRVRKIKQE